MLRIYNLLYVIYLSLQHKEVVWEQELYTNFTYNAVQPYFHVFESDVSVSYHGCCSLRTSVILCH